MNSVLYSGELFHRRLAPVDHVFRYPVLFFGFDLDDLTRLDAALPAFGYNRRRCVSLHDRDYLGRDHGTLRERSLQAFREAGAGDRVARVLLVTCARWFGAVFNPVSFHLGFEASGALTAVLAEVNNTFGDRYLYPLPALESDAGHSWRTASCPKAFHVSPFNDLRGEYRFRFAVTPERVDIRVDLLRDGRVVLETRLGGEAQPLTSARLNRALLCYPLLPLLTVPRILAQAARLAWARRLPAFRRPEPAGEGVLRRRKPSAFDRFAMRAVLALLGRLRTGRLRLEWPDGTCRVFGPPGAVPEATLHIHRYDFFRRILLSADVGFGEAYVAGDFSCEDLTGALELLIDNREAIADGSGPLSRLGAAANRIGHRLRPNSRARSRRNIHDHYDVGNDFFRTFLDPSMTYSAARFAEPGEDLESAQLRKLHLLIDKARIGPEHHVLEIGTGWGSFAIEAARRTGCRVTTITVSEEQCRLARERVAAAGLDDRIDVRFSDYRLLDGVYDRIVSIEMLEAVGHAYLDTFFRTCERILAPGGLAVFQVITIPDQRYHAYRRGCDFIRKHMFPGGHLPSLEAIVRSTRRTGMLNVEDLENIGPDYARTLRRWREAFVANLDRVAALGLDGTFMRTWLYYLAYCEAAFSTRTLNTLQLVLTRPVNRTLDREAAGRPNPARYASRTRRAVPGPVLRKRAVTA